MSKPIPTVQKYMTTSPHTVGEDQPMSVAHRMMREYHIRHLPVLRGSKIVGLVSDRDLNMVETLKDVDPRKVLVSEAMTQDPYVVSPDAALDEVVSTMGETKDWIGRGRAAQPSRRHLHHGGCLPRIFGPLTHPFG